MIFTIANRWRGTYGWFAKVFGVVIFAITLLITGNFTVALLLGGGWELQSTAIWEYKE